MSKATFPFTNVSVRKARSSETTHLFTLGGVQPVDALKITCCHDVVAFGRNDVQSAARAKIPQQPGWQLELALKV